MRERQRSQSPPTYQVYETKDGRLVNRTLQVQWPNHSIGNKKLFDGYILKEGLEESSGTEETSSQSESEAVLKTKSDKIDEMVYKKPLSTLDESKYIGAA
uniref:Uncharacterized protein n=2 Tax=Panagrolaimus sp. ES5 TaxID=591445 RepID=A0AC34FW44_9BILA